MLANCRNCCHPFSSSWDSDWDTDCDWERHDDADDTDGRGRGFGTYGTAALGGWLGTGGWGTAGGGGLIRTGGWFERAIYKYFCIYYIYSGFSVIMHHCTIF